MVVCVILLTIYCRKKFTTYRTWYKRLNLDLPTQKPLTRTKKKLINFIKELINVYYTYSITNVCI